MGKALLNYTTSVEVERTVGEIARILVGHGASSISTDYLAGRPVSVSFVLVGPRGRDAYRLPTRVDRVRAVLERQRKAGLIAPRHCTAEQAARVAWRILRDWVEAQLAIVAAGMVDLDEVLLPYQLQEGRTFFEWYAERKLEQLEAEPGDPAR
jgi:hypothetical protein